MPLTPLAHRRPHWPPGGLTGGFTGPFPAVFPAAGAGGRSFSSRELQDAVLLMLPDASGETPAGCAAKPAHSGVEALRYLNEIGGTAALLITLQGDPGRIAETYSLLLAEPGLLDMKTKQAWLSWQLQQVVGNMLDNALRYCRHVPGSILLAAYALDETHAELVIWNDGPEVPTEQQRSLFEPFFTNDAQGTGLGLYMARELCSANDAQIRYGAIALESLLDRTGALTMEARDTLPRRAFVITLMFDQPAVLTAE